MKVIYLGFEEKKMEASFFYSLKIIKNLHFIIISQKLFSL